MLSRSLRGSYADMSIKFQDYIDDVAKFGRRSKVKVSTLKGGIKGWVKDFEGSMVDGFEEKYWEQFK